MLVTPSTNAVSTGFSLLATMECQECSMKYRTQSTTFDTAGSLLNDPFVGLLCLTASFTCWHSRDLMIEQQELPVPLLQAEVSVPPMDCSAFLLNYHRDAIQVPLVPAVATEATEMVDLNSPVVDSNFIVTRIRDERDQDWDTRKSDQHSVSGDLSNLQSHGV